MASEKQEKNLKRFGKEIPALTHEQAVEYGRRGGKAKAENDLLKITTEKAFSIIENMPVKGKTKKHLEELGIPEEQQVGGVGIIATIYAMCMAGDREMLKKYLDFKIQLEENERKKQESKARIDAMTKGEVQVTSEDEDEGMVQIYLPAIEEPQEE